MSAFMLDPELALTIIVSTAMLIAILWKKLMTPSAALASFFIGILIGVGGGFYWLLLLLFLLFTSIVATRYRFELKRRMGVQEGKKGERGLKSIMANGGVAVIIAALVGLDLLDQMPGSLIFISALCVAGADTIASEVGVLSKDVRLITTWKRVRPGTDGGISLMGTAWALLAASYIALVGYLLLLRGEYPPIVIFVPLIAGFVGCMLDSVVGATIERAGRIDKNGNNLISIAFGAVATWTWTLL